MSTLADRMRWMPGQASPPLTLVQVLTMLGVADAPLPAQRKAVERALAAGDLGTPSLAALREAGWLDSGVHPAVAPSGGQPVGKPSR